MYMFVAKQCPWDEQENLYDQIICDLNFWKDSLVWLNKCHLGEGYAEARAVVYSDSSDHGAAAILYQ